MVKCPFCDQILQKQSPDGWLCECGETIAYGFELDAAENCETCPVMYCPKRVKPQRIDVSSAEI